MADTGHQNSILVRDLTRSFDLTGDLPKSGMFKNNFRPAEVSCENSKVLPGVSPESILNTVCSAGDVELASLLWATTKEVEKGFLEGLVSPDSLVDQTILCQTEKQSAAH